MIFYRGMKIEPAGPGKWWHDTALIYLKAVSGERPIVLAFGKKRGATMPTETVIVVAGIILMFAVFAVTLAWADHYARNYRAPGASYFDANEM